MKTFLIVFNGKWKNDKIVDIGNDPCFDEIPSWGICRPNARKYIKVGNTLVFIAKIGSEYYLKGWFVVGEKLDYITAKKRFPLRENVIISKSSVLRKNDWDDNRLKKHYAAIYDGAFPDFLLSIQFNGNLFFQNPADDHKLDNWKCRRIYNCQKSQLEHCISINTCLKKHHSLLDEQYRNYVVADEDKWDDVDNLKINLEDIRRETGFSKSIKTPRNQHNVLLFDEYREALLNYIAARKNQIISHQRHRSIQ